MRYEHVSRRPISTREFLIRMLRHGVLASGIISLSIVVGMAGYEYYEHLAWRDALLNTTMLLGGMGPVDAPQSPGGKLFASFFALYAGLVFIATAGVVLAPVGHRVLHHLNFDGEETETRRGKKA
jgi:hypothetical protein